jgi:hypothetical protein
VKAAFMLSVVLCAMRAGEDIGSGICPFFKLPGALNCCNLSHITFTMLF